MKFLGLVVPGATLVLLSTANDKSETDRIDTEQKPPL